MKLVLFDDYRPGVLKDDRVVDISQVVSVGTTGQETMERLISNFEALRPAIERHVLGAASVPVDQVKLRAPLPRPGKLMAMAANYQEHGGREPAPREIFFKSPDSVLDPGGTVVLPKWEFPIFHHEAELVVVIGSRSASNITPDRAFDYVFGYTAGVDVSARSLGRGGFLGKSFDTFSPLGPCIVTKDEIPDVHDLHVQLRVDGRIRHDYNTDDMLHKIPAIIEWASSIMTMRPGDAIFCGTNHEGLGPLQDGDEVEMEIERIGKFSFGVTDPLKRRWYKSTDVEAEKQGITPRQPLSQ